METSVTGWALPPAVACVLERLEQAGYAADLVGGCVRDALRGVTPHDYDVTTAATPDEILAAFADRRVLTTGVQHGTVTVLIGEEPVEVTTYRVDGNYRDGRHPESVRFTTSLTEDLARRDLTVNAMAYSPRRGLTDPFGGRQDLQVGVLRTVGVPEQRFREDALRILRAMRFSSVLGMTVEPQTAAAMHALRQSLLCVSAERIFSELYKLLGGTDAYDVILEFADIVRVFLPELRPEMPISKQRFTSLPQNTRFYALFEPTAKPDRVAEACRRLRTPSALLRVGERIQALRHAPLCREGEVATLLFHAGREAACEIARLREAEGECPGASQRIEAFLASGRPYTLAQLAVRGEDLVRCGYRGAEIGEGLHALLMDVMEGRLPNVREALLAAIEPRS